jgi:probable F420-dependent oxidoreductase
MDPSRCIEEAKDAVRVGLGGVWISERFALKEPAVIGGLLAHAAPGLRIGGTFYAHLRHPIVTASVANLMQALTGDRFTLVLARASEAFFAGYGIAPLTFARLADSISIFRQLWRGEAVDYDGILGRFEGLRLTDRHEGPPPPIVFTAMGPKALDFAGRHCDGVLLHPMLTASAVAKSAAAVRAAASDAGRDPTSIRIIANVIVAPDLPKAEEDAVVAGRAVTYLQSTTIGPLLTAINGWDAGELAKLRQHPTIARHDGKIVSQAMTRDQLVEAGLSLPSEWLETGAVAGSSLKCADQLCEFLDAGADEILLHGSAPGSMMGLTAALADKLAARSRMPAP